MSAANTGRGKVTEQLAARWFRANGFPGAERTVRTGHRSADRVLADEGDLDLCPGVIVSVKSLRPANRAERAVSGWLADAEAQRVAAGADVALLVVRREGTADVGEWFAWSRLGVLRMVAAGNAWALSRTYGADAGPAVRLAVADVARLLRAAGYGTPIATSDEETP